MRVLWSRGASTSNKVVSELAPLAGWKPNTVKTLLARLEKKGVVKVERSAREHRYIAAISEAESAMAESRSFLSRVYNGAMMPMFAGFIEREKLTKREIAQLRQLLDEAERRTKK